ncbi:unnamed protein product, partial [Ectocarpus sp. 12 AP-2014]
TGPAGHVPRTSASGEDDDQAGRHANSQDPRDGKIERGRIGAEAHQPFPSLTCHGSFAFVHRLSSPSDGCFPFDHKTVVDQRLGLGCKALSLARWLVEGAG